MHTPMNLTPQDFKTTLDTIYNTSMETRNYKLLDIINLIIQDRYKNIAATCKDMSEMWQWVKDNEPEYIYEMFSMHGNLDDEFYDSLTIYTQDY